MFQNNFIEAEGVYYLVGVMIECVYVLREDFESFRGMAVLEYLTSI